LTDSEPGELARAIAAARAHAAAQVESLRRTFDDIVASTELANDDEHDPDGSTIAFERAKVTALCRAAELQLAELDAAAARLEGGVYGTCEVCGAPIPEERLHALPTARACVRCA
jgi:RNA polymerase-binding transcription factor DksA